MDCDGSFQSSRLYAEARGQKQAGRRRLACNIVLQFYATMNGRKIPYSELHEAWQKGLEPSDIIVFPGGHEIDFGTISAMQQKAADEIHEILSTAPDLVNDSRRRIPFVEGSQPVCGSQSDDTPANFIPCNLPRGHKGPHVCRVRAIRLGFTPKNPRA